MTNDYFMKIMIKILILRLVAAGTLTVSVCLHVSLFAQKDKTNESICFKIDILNYMLISATYIIVTSETPDTCVRRVVVM